MDVPAHPTTRALTALVVEPVASDREFAAATLVDAGFAVVVAQSFEEGEARLAQDAPSVLLADIRLGEYNGLHLVLRARALQLRLAALVTYDRPDPVLQADAERLGATFITKPITASQLVAAAFRTLLRGPNDDRAVQPPFERRTGERRVLQFTPRPSERRGSDRRRSHAVLLGAVRPPS